MALRGHVFNKQLFSSDCFAVFIDTFLGKNSGIVKGCELSNTNSSISLGSGYFCIKGRFLQEEGGSTFNIEQTVEQDLYCQLICEIDMSKENTTSELNQATYKILESPTGYTVLQQEELNDGGTIYQFEFARFKVTENGVEEFQDKRIYLDFNSMYEQIDTAVTTLLEELRIEQGTEFTNWMTGEKAEFDTWVTTLQEVLDENTAAHLLSLINENKELINQNKDSINENTKLINTKADKKKTWNVSVPTTGWSASAPYTITIPVEGITANDTPNIYPIYSTTLATRQTQIENYAKITMATSSANSITFTCDTEKPTIALNIGIEVVY